MRNNVKSSCESLRAQMRFCQIITSECALIFHVRDATRNTERNVRFATKLLFRIGSLSQKDSRDSFGFAHELAIWIRLLNLFGAAVKLISNTNSNFLAEPWVIFKVIFLVQTEFNWNIFVLNTTNKTNYSLYNYTRWNLLKHPFLTVVIFNAEVGMNSVTWLILNNHTAIT